MQQFSLQQFSYASQGVASITVPRAQIFGQLYDANGVLVADYTGANAVSFPQVLATLTPAQALHIVDMVAPYVLACKAGLD
jgi:hypothetical protein